MAESMGANNKRSDY